MYEPYLIMRNDSPMWDEGFNGRHLNKNMHAWDMACDGYSFVVLHDAYLVHRNRHQIIPYVKEDFDTMIDRWEDVLCCQTDELVLVLLRWVAQLIVCHTRAQHLYQFSSFCVVCACCVLLPM